MCLMLRAASVSETGHYRIHLCTPTQDQLPYYTALRRWLSGRGHIVLIDFTAPLEAKMHAAAVCDLCILLLGPTFGPCAPLSSFSDVELEASTATDVHPGKLLAFAQDNIGQPSSPEQAEFIERQRHFTGGTFSSTFRTPEELIIQVYNAFNIWKPPEPLVPLRPLNVSPDAVMISSVTALMPAREAIHAVLLEHQIPVIDFVRAPGESVTPIDRVIAWARECRALLL